MVFASLPEHGWVICTYYSTRKTGRPYCIFVSKSFNHVCCGKKPTVLDVSGTSARLKHIISTPQRYYASIRERERTRRVSQSPENRKTRFLFFFPNPNTAILIDCLCSRSFRAFTPLRNLVEHGEDASMFESAQLPRIQHEIFDQSHLRRSLPTPAPSNEELTLHSLQPPLPHVEDSEAIVFDNSSESPDCHELPVLTITVTTRSRQRLLSLCDAVFIASNSSPHPR